MSEPPPIDTSKMKYYDEWLESMAGDEYDEELENKIANQKEA